MSDTKTPEEYLRSDIDDHLGQIRDSLNAIQPEARKLATATAENVPADQLASTADLAKKVAVNLGWMQLTVLLLNVVCKNGDEEESA